MRALVIALAALLAASCVDRLPDQDRRIRSEIPVAKMSPADLWNDFQQDAAGARARYWGRAVEISGRVTSADAADSTGPYLLFVTAGEFGIRANLLEDDAAAILKEAQPGRRVTLKCYCEGLDGHVVLKSCVTP